MKLFTPWRRKREGRVLETRDKAVLVGGLGVFTIICAWLISRSSIWFDEAFGAYLVRFGYGDVARYTASDVHPPLYYWVLKAWTGVFGTTEIGFRSLNVLMMAVAIVFAFLLVFRYLGRRAAWTGLVFMVLTPFVVRYAVEARMYAMVAAIGFAATYVLTLADRSKKTWQWALYGVLVGFGMLTHYFSLLIWLTHWLWRFIVYRSSGLKGRPLLRAYFSRGWLVAHAVAFALFAPWLGALYNQFTDVSSNGFWIPPFTPATPLNFLTNVTVYREQGDVQSWLALLFGLFTVALGILVVALTRRVLVGEQKNYYLLIAMLAAIPPILLLLLSLPPLKPAFVDRYVVPSALAVGLLIGVSIGLGKFARQRNLVAGIGIAALVLFAVGIGNVHWLGNYNNTLHESNNTREVLARIRTESAPAPVIMNSPWLYYEAAFYSGTDYPVMFIDAQTEYKYGSLLMLRENDLGKIKNLSDFEAANRQFWYVGRPKDGELTPPAANLSVIRSFRYDDTVTGAKAYEAILYQVQ